MDYHAAKAHILHRLRQGLAPELTYHGLHHTLDVLAVTEELCVLEDVPAYEAMLLRTAALYHDSGFLISNRNHEQLGCEIVREELPRYRYTGEEIERICSMIMATRIPQRPQNEWEAILCDADLDYLGRDDFRTIGAQLFAELQAYHILQTEEQWNRLQVDFLIQHAYFTATSQLRRRPTKLQHLAELQAIVESYPTS